MKKRTIILYVSLGIIMLPIVVFAFIVFNRFHNWGSFRSTVQPMDKGTYWETEDGNLVFETGYEMFSYYDPQTEVNVLYGHETTGTLSNNEQELDICISFSPESPEMFIYICHDNGPIPHVDCELIESWKAIDYKETDRQIVYEMEVTETTYFRIGEVVNLIYKKPS